MLPEAEAEIGKRLDGEVERLFALLREVEELGQRRLGQLGADEAAHLGLDAVLLRLGKRLGGLRGIALELGDLDVALDDLVTERLDDDVHGLLVHSLGRALGRRRGGSLRGRRRLGGIGHGLLLVCFATCQRGLSNLLLRARRMRVGAGEGVGVAGNADDGKFVKLGCVVDDNEIVTHLDEFER